MVKTFTPRLSILAHFICALCGTAAPLIGNAAEDWDIGYQPHLEIGVVDYTLDVSAISQLNPALGGATSAGKTSFGATMPSASAGLTLFADRFFLDLSAQRMETFDQSMGDSHTIIATTPAAFITTDIGYDSDDFSRDEYTLSFGYGITTSVSVYAGYKRQYTSVNQLQGSAPALLQLADGTQLQATFNTRGDFKFDYDGPFVGGTTSWKITSDAMTGRLAFSAAVAFLQGSLNVESDNASLIANNGVVLDDRTKPSDLFDTAGDAVGITLGASWAGQTNIAELTYSVAVNGYSYDFSAEDEGRADFSEDVLQLKVGLAYAL